MRWEILVATTFSYFDQYSIICPLDFSSSNLCHTHANILLTLGYLTLIRCDESSLYQHPYGDVPAGRATVPGVTGAAAAQVV